jgi:hypothetical protein
MIPAFCWTLPFQVVCYLDPRNLFANRKLALNFLDKYLMLVC